MIEKDGNTIAVVLTAASAMTAGVSVYTIATSQNGYGLLKPVVFSLEKTLQSEEFHDNYFIEKNKNKTSQQKNDSFLQEALSLASSILKINPKNNDTSVAPSQVIVENDMALETPNASPSTTITDVHPTLLSGSPLEQEQHLSLTTTQYAQSVQGTPLNVEAKPVTTSTHFMSSPNAVAMADYEYETAHSSLIATPMSSSGQSITPMAPVNFDFSRNNILQEMEESQLEIQEETQVEDELVVNAPFVVSPEESFLQETEETQIEDGLVVNAPFVVSPEESFFQETNDVSNVQVIVMDSTDAYQDALLGPAMAEESTPMAMAENGEGQAFFEESFLTTMAEENLFQAPEAEVPAPTIPDPEEPPVAIQPEEPEPTVAEPIGPSESELPFEEVDPGLVQPEEQPPLPVEEQPVIPQEPEVPTAPSYGDLNARIAEEALKLVDTTNGLWCTQVVQMAMSNAGVEDALNLWPNEFVDMYGHYTNDPQPGNLIYYNQGGNGLDHIAIYIGDGKAVHGNYSIDGESKTVIANAKLPGCDDYGFIQVER